MAITIVAIRENSRIDWTKSIYMIHGAIKHHQEENHECYSMHTVIKIIQDHVKKYFLIILVNFSVLFRLYRIYAYLPKISKLSSLECFIAFCQKPSTKLIIIFPFISSFIPLLFNHPKEYVYHFDSSCQTI